MQTVIKENLKQELDRLNDQQLKQLADFIAFIKFQSKLSQPKPELQLLQALERTNSTLPNQKGKPTARPTLRWILQCFQSIHLVFVNGVKSSIQLTHKQNFILQFLGSSSRQYYFLS